MSFMYPESKLEEALKLSSWDGVGSHWFVFNASQLIFTMTAMSCMPQAVFVP